MQLMHMALAVLVLAAPAGPAYEVVAEMGWNKAVYVSGPAIRDKAFYEKIIPDLLDRFGRQHPVQIEFYDDKEMTPSKKPYTLQQRLHQRAKFNFNPKNGMQRLVWVEPVDPAADKVKFKETEVPLSLPAPAAP